jgi:signal peptidase I
MPVTGWRQRDDGSTLMGMRHLGPAPPWRRRVPLGWRLAALVAGVLAGALALRRRRLEPVAVAGVSMLPTLPAGTLLAVAPVSLPLRRGQLVVVQPAAAGRRELVKRVVGLPGEHVRLDGGRLWVDGREVHEPYVSPPATATPAAGFQVRLGAGEYLVLGDRRDASTDGRDFGPVTVRELRGVIKFAYWPPRVAARRAIAMMAPHPWRRGQSRKSK